MGIDLTLLPLTGADTWSAEDQLLIERRRELWAEIEKMPVAEIPEPVHCPMAKDANGHPALGPAETDDLGRRLTWTTAGMLSGLREHQAVQDHWKNRAVWSYLAQMPADWKIVLYWH